MTYDWKQRKTPADPLEWFTVGASIRVEVWGTKNGFKVNVRYHHRLMCSVEYDDKHELDRRFMARVVFENIKMDFNGQG